MTILSMKKARRVAIVGAGPGNADFAEPAVAAGREHLGVVEQTPVGEQWTRQARRICNHRSAQLGGVIYMLRLRGICPSSIIARTRRSVISPI
jgi:hypothetical protein